MKKHIHILAILALGLGLSSCTETTIADLSPVPKISLEKVEPEDIQAFEDLIYLTISYEDGNGDLGEIDPDLPSVFVKVTLLTTGLDRVIAFPSTPVE